MPRCEMCGNNEESLTTVKVSQAELDVCENCTDMGTVIDSGEEKSEAETKYNVNSSDGQSETNDESENTDNTTGFESAASPTHVEMTELRSDYGDVIRGAREQHGMTIANLAEEVGEKESHIRKIEQGDRRPTEDLQYELESVLDVDLTADEDIDVDEFSGDGTGQTLGDVVDFES